MAISKQDGNIVVEIAAIRRVVLVVLATTCLIGGILFSSIALGSRIQISTASIVSIVIGLSGLVLTVYSRVDWLYKRVTGPPEVQDQESLSESFSLLCNDTRRQVLSHLDAKGSSMELGELAEAIASDRYDVSVKELSSDQRKRVYVSLYQTHLPRLQDGSAVEFDQARGIVQFSERGKDLLTRLELFTNKFAGRLNIDSPEELDSVFYAIRNIRRRYVLHHLAEAEEGTADLRGLSEQIAAWENDTDSDNLSSSQRKRVYVGLYQTHLDVLANEGFVNWDQDQGMVVLTDQGSIVAEYLSLIEGKQDFPLSDVPWARLRKAQE